MLLSDLQNKDVISTVNGDNLGRIIDAELDENGQVLNFYAENKKFFRKYFNNNEIVFKFTDIDKVGTDCILVKF